MSINQNCLESEIQFAIDNLTTSCSAETFLETALAADSASPDRKFTVALGCQLPDLNTANIPQGTIVYVEELGVPVVSTGLAWKGLDGRLYRKDKTATTLLTWGNNQLGQLGDNTNAQRFTPVIEASYSLNWASSSSSSCALSSFIIGTKEDSTLWSWGSNNCGQLGINTMVSYSSPVQEITSAGWLFAGAGASHTSAIKLDGTLWSWGNNCQFALGNGNSITTSSPVQELSSSTDWCMVSPGNCHSSAIKTDGTLWSWGGSNGYGVIGDGFNACRCSPVRERSSSSNWCLVSTKIHNTTAIKTDGTLWSWGRNNTGAIGDDTIICRSSPVRERSSSSNWCLSSAGDGFSTGIKTDGTLWSWGANFQGQVGINITLNVSSPVQEISSSTNWVFISLGRNHSAALKADNSLWLWGNNGGGQLGDCTFVSKSSPIQEITFNTNWCSVSSGYRYNSALKVI